MIPTTSPIPTSTATPTAPPTAATAGAPGAAADFRERRRFPSVGGKIVVHDVELARLAKIARRERLLAEAAALAERSAAAA